MLAGLLSAVVAFISGVALMRLSGIAASIGTFALFMSFYSFYLQWSSWTAGQSSLVGIPVTTTPWVALVFAYVAMVTAFFGFGRAQPASQELSTSVLASTSRCVIPRDKVWQNVSRLSVRSTSWFQRAVWNMSPAKASIPSIVG